MKKTVLGLCLLGFTAQTFCQDQIFETKLKKEDIPVTVIHKLEKDFPDLVAKEFTALPLEYIENDVVVNRNIKSNDDYEVYSARLSGKGRELETYYNREGKLLSTVERNENITPPTLVRKELERTYPSWNIAKDSYKMTSYSNGKKKEHYKFILEKGKERKKVYTDAKGKILDQHLV